MGHVPGCHEPSRARHILDDDRWLPGKILPKALRHHPGLAVETATRSKRHNYSDGLTCVVIGGVSCERWRRTAAGDHKHRRQEQTGSQPTGLHSLSMFHHHTELNPLRRPAHSRSDPGGKATRSVRTMTISTKR